MSNTILVTNRYGQVCKLAFNPRHATFVALFTLLVLCGAILYSGFRLGTGVEVRNQLSEVDELQALSSQQQADIAAAREAAQSGLDALTLRLGRMQAQMLRVDALGERLVAQADLEADEFDFDLPPPVGGPGNAATLSAINVPDFLGMLDELDLSLTDRKTKLTALEQMLMDRQLDARILPSGRAVEHGILSSKFGARIDPFSGKREQHKGIDIAGKHGADVMAVGDGVVIWSGERSGYGQLVEVDHGNGYVTRYGHNSGLRVEAGDTVRRGQTIASLGSTGRSTGPHVHIEVLLNGKQVNPSQYLSYRQAK